MTVFDVTALAALADVQQLLLSPQAFRSEREWRRTLAQALRRLFGVDYAIVLRPGSATPYVGDGMDASGQRSGDWPGHGR